MECLNRFKAKMSRTGSSIRDDMVKSSKMILDQTFYDDASFLSGVYFWRLGLLDEVDYVNESEIHIRIYKRNFSNANGWTAKFQTLADTPVQVGDIIYYSVEQEYFLCTESFNIDGIHYQGKLTLCNWILKWQNQKGNILQYPAFVVNSTQYNSGEQSTRQYTIGSSQHLIKLPCDNNTKIIRSPQRFMLDKNHEDPITYIVTQNDTVTYAIGKKGIVAITVLETPINRDTDNIELGICDYKVINTDDITDNSDGNINPETENNNVIKSSIKYSTKVIKSGGNAKTFTARFVDENNNEIEILPKWEIVCDFVNKLNTKMIGNSIKISVDDDSLVDDDFKLILTDENGNYMSSLIITIKSLL